MLHVSLKYVDEHITRHIESPRSAYIVRAHITCAHEYGKDIVSMLLCIVMLLDARICGCVCVCSGALARRSFI